MLTAAAVFHDLLFRREWPVFMVFDVLAIEGKDLRGVPRSGGSADLRASCRAVSPCSMPFEPIARRLAARLFELACERDLEGIVAKWKHGSYPTDGHGPSWLKDHEPKLQPSRRAGAAVSSNETPGPSAGDAVGNNDGDRLAISVRYSYTRHHPRAETLRRRRRGSLVERIKQHSRAVSDWCPSMG